MSAKNALNAIDYKLKSEFALIQEVDNYLRMVEENAEDAQLKILETMKIELNNILQIDKQAIIRWSSISQM